MGSFLQEIRGPPELKWTCEVVEEVPRISRNLISSYVISFANHNAELII